MQNYYGMECGCNHNNRSPVFMNVMTVSISIKVFFRLWSLKKTEIIKYWLELIIEMPFPNDICIFWGRRLKFSL